MESEVHHGEARHSEPTTAVGTPWQLLLRWVAVTDDIISFCTTKARFLILSRNMARRADYKQGRCIFYRNNE